jgi:protein-S-isoprenylcysteine O-methyltransferase Ste14
VSLTLIYAGVGVALNNAWVLGLLVPLLVVMRYRLIAREEEYLARKFGDQYRRYRASVRRWI